MAMTVPVRLRPPRPRTGSARPATRRRPGAPPDPDRLIRLVARTYLEVEAGRRPLAQIEPLLCPALTQRLRRSLRRRSGAGPGPDPIISVRRTEPRAGVADAVVVVRRADRVGAVVIRIERRQGLWRVVEIGCPEDGRHPDA